MGNLLWCELAFVDCCVLECGPGEVGSAEVGSAEDGFAEIGFSEVGVMTFFRTPFFPLRLLKAKRSVICRPRWQNPAGYASQVHRRELLRELCSSRHFGSGRGFTCRKVHQVEGQPMRVVHLVLVALSEKQVGPLPRVGSRSRFELV